MCFMKNNEVTRILQNIHKFAREKNIFAKDKNIYLHKKYKI